MDARTVTAGQELVWVYPADASTADPGDAGGEWDSNGIGYGSIRVETVTGMGKYDRLLRFDLSSTVGGIASGEAYENYEADWFRSHLSPPSNYEGGFEAYVAPPQSFRIETHYGQEDGSGITVEAPAVGTAGTIYLRGARISTRSPTSSTVRSPFRHPRGALSDGRSGPATAKSSTSRRCLTTGRDDRRRHSWCRVGEKSVGVEMWQCRPGLVGSDIPGS